MSVIVTDQGFSQDDFDGAFTPLADLPANDAQAIDVASSEQVEPLAGRLNQITMIRIDFPSFADGRGFTLAARLRRLGYRGRLRAKGHVISDQYAMARRAGFDEVEISDDLAARPS